MSSIHLFHRAEDLETFAAGQVIFQAGDAGEVMYIIAEGQVDILVHQKVIETFEAGDILGEMALIDKKPRSASAIAKTDCKLAPIDEKRFTFLVQQTPYFAIQVMRVMADRLRRWHDLLP